MSTIRDRVRAGATLLDAHAVGWADRIDPAGLDMGVCDHCVLGHVYGHFILAARDLSGLPSDEEDYGENLSIPQWDWTVAHGFHDGSDEETEWAALRLAWLDEIAARRDQAPAATSHLQEAHA